MHLRSLTLRGFKSFAERTALRFESGITAIVGPNGSGKSNISDAVMWVLGEQSPRTLRSGSMEDVIFAGSSARPALGMAEVSLCLSNSDGLLPIEFSEVTITRRLYRSGESDYYINNAPCRLFDIQELLSDSGLGKGLYSIISQGRLEEILSSKPEEKRLLIEDVAGILKYKKRKERALRRLKSMEQNLQRAKDISQEINRQLKPLKAQASKAQEHIALGNRLRSLEIGLAIADLKELHGEWETTTSYETGLKFQLDDKKEELAKKHLSLEKFQSEFEAKNIYSSDISEKRRRLQSVEDKLRSNIILLDEKSKNTKQRIGEIKYNISQTEHRKNSLLEQQIWVEKEKATLSSELKKDNESLSTFENNLTNIHGKRQNIDGIISDLKGKTQTDRRILEKQQSEFNNIQLSIQTTENQLKFLKNELETLARRKSSLLERAEQKKRDSELVSIEVTRLELQVSELSSRIHRMESEFSEKHEEESSLRQRHAAVKARIKALEEVIKSFPTTEDIIKSMASIDMPDMLGLIKDVLTVKPEYERCIEAVLGDNVFCMVLEQFDELSRIEGVNESKPSGLTSFIVSDRARFKLPRNDLNQATWALDVVSYPDKFKYSVSALLSHVYIVPDFKTALSMQDNSENEILVTVDGEIFLPNGEIILGAASNAAGILGYQRELKELSDSSTELEDAIRKGRETQTELSRQIETLKAQKSKISSEFQEKKIEYANLKQSLADIEPELSKLILQNSGLQSQIHMLESQFNRSSEKIVHVKKELSSQKDKMDSLLFELEELLKSRDKLLEDESKLKVELGRIKVGLNALNDKMSANARRASNITRELDNFDNQIEIEEGLLIHLEKLQDNVAPIRSTFEQVLRSVSYRYDQIKEMTSFQEGSVEGLKQDIKQSQLDIAKLNDLIEAMVKQIHEAQVRKAQLELKVTGAVQKVVDEFDIPLEKALEHEVPLGLDEARAEASGLRRRMAMLGPINPIAVDEYTHLEERYRFFSEQIEDLQRSKRALMKVIGAIEEKMKSRFIETFDIVNENFQAIFELLFPGGQAELILTDPEDIQNSSVDVIAQPGGKKLQRLSLLSGGEKSLVALAFSFALYHTRPSPFYILDEVEAALDDMNLKRFMALLQKIRQDSQVLIVTHQRRTMEVADSLYGVSMQADGVSRLISQKFNEVTVGVG